MHINQGDGNLAGDAWKPVRVNTFVETQEYCLSHCETND